MFLSNEPLCISLLNQQALPLQCGLPKFLTLGTSLVVQWLRLYAPNAGGPRFDSWSRRRKWQPTSVFLPGESHGQRNLADYSPWGRKESDMFEKLTHIPENHHISYLQNQMQAEYVQTISSISSFNKKKSISRCDKTFLLSILFE